MEIEITAITDTVMIDRDVKIGDRFHVISQGKSKEKLGMTYYYIEPNGKPLIVYQNECNVI